MDARLRVRLLTRTYPLADAVLAWSRVPHGRRLCLLCLRAGAPHAVENAVHFVFSCPSLEPARRGLIRDLLACVRNAGVSRLLRATPPAAPWPHVVLGGDVGIEGWEGKSGGVRRHPAADRRRCLRVSGPYLRGLARLRWRLLRAAADTLPLPAAWTLHPVVRAAVGAPERP